MPLHTNQVVVDNTPLQVDGSAFTQPVSGTITANAGTGPFPVSDNGGSLTIDGTVSVSNFPGASAGIATTTLFSITTTEVTISTSNAAKTKVVVHNESGTLLVKLGTSVSATSYTYRLPANTVVEIEGYYGVITAIKTAGAASNVLVTELGI